MSNGNSKHIRKEVKDDDNSNNRNFKKKNFDAEADPVPSKPIVIISEPDYIYDYDSYVEAFTASGYDKKYLLSYDDFVASNYRTNVDGPHPHGLTFNMPIAPGSVIGSAKDFSNAWNAGQDAWSKAKDGDYLGAVSALEDAGASAGSAVKVLREKGDNGGPPKTGTKSRYGGKGSDNNPVTAYERGGASYSLTSNHQPVEIRLSTGIKPNAFGQFYNECSSYYVPLHLTQTRLSFSNINTSSRLYKYFDQVVSHIWGIDAQLMVQFNIQSSTNFSTTILIDYYEKIALAMQLYYFYTSVLTYCKDRNHHNEGMKALRDMISSDDVDLLSRLGETLGMTPIPPRLNELCLYLMQTYQSSSQPNASLLKLMPTNFALSADVNGKMLALDPTNSLHGLNVAYNNLQDPTFRSTCTLIAQICPGWLPRGNFKVPGAALHDLNFINLWANLPSRSTGTGGASCKTPFASTDDESICYATAGDDLDGMIFGLATIYNTTTSKFSTGIMHDLITSTYLTSKLSNRFSFMYSGSSNGFYASNQTSYGPYTRGEAYNIVSAGIATTPFGMEYTLGANINSVTETAFASLRWIVDLNSIGSGYKDNKKREVPTSHYNVVKDGSGGTAKPSRRRDKRRK